MDTTNPHAARATTAHAAGQTAGHLTPADLMTLERYAGAREAFRAKILEHKRLRNVAVGPHTTWCFEDRLTVQYQIQEMLRAERIFEADAIQEELDSYNPLIPDGTNLKATLLIEYTDEIETAPGARTPEGHRSALLARGRRGPLLRDSGRRPRARKLDEDLCRALLAVRARIGRTRGAEVRRSRRTRHRPRGIPVFADGQCGDQPLARRGSGVATRFVHSPAGPRGDGAPLGANFSSCKYARTFAR